MLISFHHFTPDLFQPVLLDKNQLVSIVCLSSLLNIITLWSFPSRLHFVYAQDPNFLYKTSCSIHLREYLLNMMKQEICSDKKYFICCSYIQGYNFSLFYPLNELFTLCFIIQYMIYSNVKNLIIVIQLIIQRWVVETD